MNSKPNFIFFGTLDVASETLEILKQNEFIPSLIVTSPDARAGRKMLLTPPAVKIWAEENKIPYIQPEKLNTEEFKNTFDLFIVVAYGKIIPENILNMPKLGSLNIHYSLLPKYRGASPVESVILNGDTETGVTIQKMEYKMDAGDIIAQEKINIKADEKAPELRKRLIKLGGELLVKILPEFIEGKKKDGLIDLNDDAVKNYNKFRAYAHWPRTFFFQNDKRIIITDAELQNGKFVIKKILPEGKKEVAFEEFNLRHGVY